MEKRSRRRTRDLVTQAASQGLSQNEIGCARISMMARSTNAPCKGRIQMRKTNPSICSNLACNARPGWVMTVGVGHVSSPPGSGHSDARRECPLRAKTARNRPSGTVIKMYKIRTV